MLKKFYSILFVLLFLISPYLTFPASVSAYSTNMSAEVVVGQTNFTNNSTNAGIGSVNAAGFALNNTVASQIFVDPNGRLIVSDEGNNRILIWNRIPTTNGKAADLVLGQPDLNSSTANNGGLSGSTLQKPGGAWSDGNKLIVADRLNNRTLIWNTFPTTNGQSADVVIGQTSMTGTDGTNCTASAMPRPTNVYVYNGKLLITFQRNGSVNGNRVVIFNSIPTTNGASADLVLGQDNLTTCTVQTTSASSILSARANPYVDPAGRLYIFDPESNRILVWNTFPTVNNKAADVVLGQSSFTTSSSGTTASSLNTSTDIIGGISGSGNRLFVSDTDNHRVLVFNSLSGQNGQPADLVLGQSNFTSGSANAGGTTSINTFSKSIDAVEYNNKLLVYDTGNARILIFNNTIDTPSMDITTPLEKLNETTLRVRGNVQLGDRSSTYALQWVKSEINGNGLGNVTSLGGGRDNGDNLTLYDFFNEFNPTVNGGSMNNYTMKLVASSFNADSTSLFYFQPFTFEYIRRTNPTLTLSKQNLNISFLVNKLSIQRMKDNIDHFEVLTSTDSGKLWKPLTSNISIDKLSDQGQIYLTIPNTLTPGTKNLIKVVSVSKNSNWRQDSPSLTYFVPVKKTARLK